ncbi:MAG: DNA polymerase/3'-5' exonuclease PolX [Chloroflexi bacterium]|nr:DNA polymerase/3'-5' exonuclease PolX [Chloroflexota bacterium]
MPAVRNAEIAKVFSTIGDLLELKGENVFKVRAYQRAARTIEQLPRELSQIAPEGKLQEVPGVGKEIAKKIEELLQTGRLGFYERLKGEFPPGLVDLIAIPGVGPKTALLVSRELGISTVEDLEKAARSGVLATLPRLGEKAAENILQRIESLRRKDTRKPIGQAMSVVEEVVGLLQKEPGVHRLIAAGSLRRFKETVGDIDLMGTAYDPPAVIQAFVRLPIVEEVLGAGPKKASAIIRGLQVDFRIVEEHQFGSLLQHFTGSKEHNVLMRERARRMGLSLSEWGITRLADGTLETFADEEGFYRRLDLQWVPPEVREATQEIALAEQGKMPRLVQIEDLRGDLHVHSDWSDGNSPIETMVAAARSLGHTYMALTDHSVGRGIAKGLSVERLREQRKELERVRARHPGIVILHGSEVDIRADGSVDYPDEVLGWLDFAVASVQSAMQQEREKMTRRVIRAMENSYVTCIGHLTTRLLGEREPVDFDVEAVFQAAVRTGTALEINASPERRDLKDTHAFRARELGVPLVISTDAHRPETLANMRFGVGVARRAWCQASDIVNTQPWDGLREFLAGKRRRVAEGVR